MYAADIENVVKIYDSRAVVNEVSFSIDKGEVFGLIGPNGAGKTTTIRMMMDIIKPDSGTIRIMGEKLNEESKSLIGYLPEERGLYRKVTVFDTLIYLASLKNVEKHSIMRRTEELLERVDMLAHKNKKVEELSRGMNQIVQFLVTIIHDPKIIVLDEPFANLDPVNTELIKDIIRELRSRGKSVILSTHRMNEVEEMCDRIFMINEGRGVLYGKLADIKERYRDNSVIIEADNLPKDINGVINRREHNGYLELFLDNDTTPQDILEQIMKKGTVINRFEISTPSLNDIFLRVVGEEQ